MSREISDELGEAHGQRRLGRLEAYQGRVPESTAALDFSLSVFSKSGYKQQQGIAWAYIAALKLLNHNPDEALEACSQARQLAGAESGERDIIRTEWLLGWADTEKSLSNAEAHLTEALTRCRRINLIESEPDILLTWTRWHRAAGHPKEARECLNHALAIADRSEYRLVQADARNLLARLALDAGDSSEARRHAEIAKERAWCDGPPHCYKPALDEAERLLAQAAP